MNAILSNYQGRKILHIFYSTSVDGGNFSAIIEAARRECGVADPCVPIICIPESARRLIPVNDFQN